MNCEKCGKKLYLGFNQYDPCDCCDEYLHNDAFFTLKSMDEILFKDDNGDCLIPIQSGGTFGKWVSLQGKYHLSMVLYYHYKLTLIVDGEITGYFTQYKDNV